MGEKKQWGKAEVKHLDKPEVKKKKKFQSGFSFLLHISRPFIKKSTPVN